MTSRRQILLVLVVVVCLAPTIIEASFFHDFLKTQLSAEVAPSSSSQASSKASTSTAGTSARSQLVAEQQEHEEQKQPDHNQEQPFTIAGLKPSNIASLLNTVSETGFSYFNVDDQCRSRTACDVGYMLYRKLNFVHNWIIRASVRTLVSSNNVYAQSWNRGMTGTNCTHIYPTCNQSPLDSLMNFAMFAV